MAASGAFFKAHLNFRYRETYKWSTSPRSGATTYLTDLHNTVAWPGRNGGCSVDLDMDSGWRRIREFDDGAPTSQRISRYFGKGTWVAETAPGGISVAPIDKMVIQHEPFDFYRTRMYDRRRLKSGMAPYDVSELTIHTTSKFASARTTWSFVETRTSVSYGKKKSNPYKRKRILLFGPTARMKQLGTALAYLNYVCTCRSHNHFDEYASYRCEDVSMSPPNIGMPVSVVDKRTPTSGTSTSGQGGAAPAQWDNVN